MRKESIKFFGLDVAKLRPDRQRANNKKARSFLEGQGNTEQKVINEDEEKRILNELKDLKNSSESLVDLLAEIKEKRNPDQLIEIITRLLSRSISINASRQGTLDEITQLNRLDEDFMAANELPFRLLNPKTHKNLVEEMVPVLKGGLMTRKEFKKKFKNNKNTSALKSFDAELWYLNECVGYVFAKVVVGKGGHQDNVFYEARGVMSWFEKEQEQDRLKEKLLVLLIDYDKKSEEKFKELYNNAANTGNENIWVVNTRSFQQKIISMMEHKDE